MKLKMFLNTVKPNDFTTGVGWSDGITFHCYLPINDDIKHILKSEATVLECEYHKDDNTYHFMAFEDKDCDNYVKNQPSLNTKNLNAALLQYAENQKY